MGPQLLCALMLVVCVGAQVGVFYWLIKRAKAVEADVAAGRRKPREPSGAAFFLIKKDMQRQQK